MISHEDLTINKRQNEEKTLRTFTNEYFNSYCKKRKRHLYLQSAQFI